MVSNGFRDLNTKTNRLYSDMASKNWTWLENLSNNSNSITDSKISETSEFLFILYDKEMSVARTSITIPIEFITAIGVSRVVEVNAYIDKRYYAEIEFSIDTNTISLKNGNLGTYADTVVVYCR